ncbi:MAG TPA: DUF2891 family protein [Terriglobia bacterium]|nr:DUF2891 family protein [Terriglobia bacterium]
MKKVIGILIVLLAGPVALAAQTSDSAKVSAYLKSLPAATPPGFDEARQEALATSAILCADHPQEAPINRNSYLWRYEKQPQILDGYDRNRAFFGCGNWHDAVASIWMLMSTLNQNPKIALASDIKDIATTHFRKGNMDGELQFFNSEHAAPGGFNFERPYGYAWIIKLYGETKAGSSPDDKKVATALAPLARWMSERLVYYLYDLKFPYRSGVETNTAWTMSLLLDGANLSDDTTLKTAIHDNALRLFQKDKSCATNFEPQNSDLISSCLSEAALMGRVMEQADYLKWLDAYLPPVYSEIFQGYAKPVDISHTNTTGSDAQLQEMAEAHLIVLQFQRADDMLTISYALPKDDPRVPVLRRLAELNANWAYAKFGVGGYEAEQIFGTYALLYENAAKGPAPLAPPEKPKGKNGSDTSDSSDTDSGNN